MGFRLGRTYVLDFDEGHGLHGAEIVMRWASIKVTEEINNLSFREALPRFIEHVVKWNLEDEEGVPVPVTLEAARVNLEPAVNKALIRAWLSAAYGVSAPLEGPSDDGRPQLEEDNTELSIPMEIQSASPVS